METPRKNPLLPSDHSDQKVTSSSPVRRAIRKPLVLPSDFQFLTGSPQTNKNFTWPLVGNFPASERPSRVFEVRSRHASFSHRARIRILQRRAREFCHSTPGSLSSHFKGQFRHLFGVCRGSSGQKCVWFPAPCGYRRCWHTSQNRDVGSRLKPLADPTEIAILTPPVTAGWGRSSVGRASRSQ